MQISSDGKNIYTGSQDRTVKHWDLVTGQCVTFSDPTAKIPNTKIVALNPSGTKAITAFEHGELQLWEVQTGNILCTLKGHPDSYPYDFLKSNHLSIQISSDETTAISSCGDLYIKFWDLKTGECMRTLDKSKLCPNHYMQAAKMKITPDMKRAVLKFGNDLVLLDLEKGLHLQTYSELDSRICYFQIFPCRTGIVTRGEDFVKFLSFYAFPEERLTKLANADKYLSYPTLVDNELAMLPQFAQADIRAIQSSNFSFEESILIYTAKTALPTIRGFLVQAIGEPDSASAPMLVSEAFARINNLPPSIRDAVWANFATIHPENPQFLKKAEIDAGIVAIDLTIKEFKAKLFAAPFPRPKPERKED